MTVNPGSSQVAGDTTQSYAIPAGSSRTFTYAATLLQNGSAQGSRIFRINQVNFGTGSTDTLSGGTSNNTNSITFGLDSLVITTQF